MKIIADKSELLEVILPTSGFSSKNNTIAAVEGILFKTKGNESCEICSYDLEKGIKSSFDCEVIEEGCCIINSARLIQIVRVMPNGKITLDIDDKSLRCTVSGGKSCFELQALNGKDFPDLPELRGDRGLEMKQSELKTLIRKTQFAISVNHIRPELRGINLAVKGNEITAVSCDGNRISLYTKICDIENVGTSELDFKVIIHGNTIAELNRFISDTEDKIKINIARKHAIFFIGKFILFTRLVDAPFLDYDRFMPKNSKIFVTTNTKELNSALERNLLITEEHILRQTKSPVICTFEEGKLTITSASVRGRVQDEIEARKEGEDIEIGFNCKLLYEAVCVCDSENVVMALTSPLMGMTIEPKEQEENTKFILLVLPVRLNK